MVQIHCHMSVGDREVAVGKGASFAQAAADLTRQVTKKRPSLLLIDFADALKAVQNEHYCKVVTTGSKYGHFTIQRRNLYKQKLSIFDTMRLFLRSKFLSN